MPQWAGSCWYYLRYLDPANDDAFISPEVERYWMVPAGAAPGEGGVDLYVGGVEHAVLHLLYARFWHKVLYDLGHVSTGSRSAGCSTRATSWPTPLPMTADLRDRRDVSIPPTAPHLPGRAGHRRAGKMGKRLKNSVTPDDMYAATGPTRCGCTRWPWGRWMSAAPGDPRHRRRSPLPAAAVAEHHQRGNRPARRHRRPAERRQRAAAAPHDHDVRSDFRDALQHRDRRAHRADRPPAESPPPAPARGNSPSRWC